MNFARVLLVFLVVLWLPPRQVRAQTTATLSAPGTPAPPGAQIIQVQLPSQDWDPRIFIPLFGSLIAAGIGLRSWWTSAEAMRTAYRPIIRPVPIEHAGHRQLILKNIGRGPALAVSLFDNAASPTLMGAVEWVEVLGPRGSGGETARTGRLLMRLDDGKHLEPGGKYRLLYQDISGQWHETALTWGPRNDPSFTVRYLGAYHWWHRGRSVPKLARDRGQVVRADN